MGVLWVVLRGVCAPRQVAVKVANRFPANLVGWGGCYSTASGYEGNEGRIEWRLVLTAAAHSAQRGGSLSWGPRSALLGQKVIAEDSKATFRILIDN